MTGATELIGSTVTHLLRSRGDDVPCGIKVTDRQMRELETQITRHDWHGEWNYRISPRSSCANFECDTGDHVRPWGHCGGTPGVSAGRPATGTQAHSLVLAGMPDGRCWAPC
ncbi:MAG TPA: hypothetical protein DHU96_06550 [Actinobacteria bacterium]|nr:hypothetical protein [Actinomycetota bacterium]